jgi:hypothetical protein
LKTKDETELLESWIEWHASICGSENIFILDNMSVSLQVADIYKSHPEITVCRYSGFLDNIHNRSIYGALYNSIGIGAVYYAFLDTDEFLTFAGDADHHDRTQVVDFLEKNMEVAVFPGIWLNNEPGSRTRFEFGGNCGNIRGGLLYGKPITRAGTQLFSDIILHNSGAIAITVEDLVLNNIIVLHMQRLFPARRIRSAVNKLIHHRALPPGATLSDALAIPDDSTLNKHARNMLAEIRMLVEHPDAWISPGGNLTVGLGEFRADGYILHSTEDQRDHFQRILEDKSLFFRTMESLRALGR